ncbi:calcium-binding protein [Bradyrhizobium sp. HKCCYLS20291]|uniref:calcium-binding protein n=1 Tax=Bradyrhizobium sp. HKCCYLS20291 TaxID=3420766 RepID=UPI003EB9C71D
MTVSYLTKTELNADLTGSNHFDPSVQAALISSLESSGVYNSGAEDGKKAWLQSGPYPGGPVAPIVQILEVTNSTTVQTDSTLKAIIMNDPGGNQLYVTDLPNAHNNVFVAMGIGNDSVNLFDSGNDTVYGGDGADVIGGGVGNSSLYGGDGNDSIYGGSGSDTLVGGAGDNYLQAGTGAHQLVQAGGSGNNLIRDFLSGSSTLVAGTGNDTIWGYGNDTLIGGSGHVELHGGVNSLLISGSGAGGANALGSGSTHSGEANVMQGGAGADSLYGGGGNDSLYGGSGSNFLVAGTGSHQLLQAGTGNTFMFDPGATGGPGTDTLVGGSGNDTIMGQQGDYFQDTGGAGSHNEFWVYGGTGASSTLQGGAGDDSFHIETKIGNDTIIGGGGTDLAGFKDRAFSDVQSLTYNSSSSSYDLVFNNGQQIHLSGVSELYFTDQVVKLT